MRTQLIWTALATMLCAAIAGAQTGPDAATGHLVVTGRVVEIHAPRLFSIREAEGAGRVWLVLAPRPLSPAVAGATVRVEGRLRRLDAGQLRRMPGGSALDERTRARLAGRSVLIAASVLAALESDLPEPEEPAVPDEQRRAEERRAIEAAEPAVPQAPTPLSIRASTLVAHLEGFAGKQVRILNARVVGVLEPRAFLIEPETRYLKALGTRDRIAVLIEHGTLGAPAELVVGSLVTVEGIARTLVGMQVTAEVPWPARLSPEAVNRLEVRAVLLARSVQTAEGTELTIK